MRAVTVTILMALGAGAEAAQNLHEQPHLSPLLAPSILELQQALNSARKIAKAYTDNLPNFIASETVRRQFLKTHYRRFSTETILRVLPSDVRP